MQKKIFLIGFIVVLLTSCKTISIQNATHKITKVPISLLHIGIEKDFLAKHSYNNTAILSINKPVKVFARVNSFNKKYFKVYSKAKLNQRNKNLNLTYIDSLETKPSFLTLTISDKVAVIEAINNKENKHLKSFLSLSSQRKLVTSITLALNDSNLNAIQQAEEVFIAPFGLKSFALNLYANNEVTQQILFHDVVIFAYQTSSICWQENRKHQLNVVDLIEGGQGCPSKTYKKSAKAKKEINYFKL